MSKLPSPFVNFFLSLLLTSMPFLVNSQGVDTEQDTLLKLRQQLDNPPSLQSWNSASPFCNWTGISCTDGKVTALLLSNMDITVAIPATICDLRNLTVLDLSYNYIPGGFPRVVFNCSKLQRLNLSQNYFVGSIPNDIDQGLSTLKYLDLGSNNFSSAIPPEIGNLTELQYLYLNSNNFNGNFPKEIGNLANLVELGLAYNGFVPSTIPVEFRQLSKLKLMWIRDANLIGPIPDSFSELSSLKQLDLAVNNLEGSIPGGLFMLKNLSYLYLFRNKLSGQIPQKVEALSLVEIDLAMNNLTGSIPEEFDKLQSLKLLNLYNNQLSGEISPGIGLISALKTLKIFTNNLSGVLPPELGLHSALEKFEVSTNHFSGQLPENLCAGGALQGIVAFSNNLTGKIPQSLGNCDTLRSVQLYNNNFSGEIPSGIWTAANMTYLMLSDNSFSGELPSSLAWNLSRLELNNNKFSGPIPTGISRWVSLIVFEASNNMLSGEIPVEVTSLSLLSTLLLDGNQLSGQLPTKIISWKSVSTLNLSRNALSGQIPAAMGSLPDLLELDLSQNHFSGEIPSGLGQLVVLNLSSNQLSGQIPDQFNNLAYENSFLNNSHLCAVNPVLNLPNCHARPRSSNKLSSKVLAVILVLAITIFIAAAILTLIVFRDYTGKKQKRDLATWKQTSFHKVDFTQANILSSLTENNLIGSGGSGKVYRIVVNHVGESVAVKSIWNNRKFDEKMEKEFAAEVEILGTIRHSNIVKLLCCISSEESKLLVYEYVENQSLDRWLHGKNRRSLPGTNSIQHVVLDWPRRMQIAIGSAQGLCYMHHHCSPPIIHRDVKCSNILLDSEFQAKIADFGLAKMLPKQGEAHTMSVVAGSFGYIAPEYAYTTKVNEKIDVYSFGVVLLELVTGREAKVGDENTNLAEWAWRGNAEGKPIVDCLDEEIKKSCYLEEMTTVFKLGLICTSSAPSSRPCMKDVLQILRRCSTRNCEEKLGSEFDVAPLLGNPTYLSSYKRSRRVSDLEFDSRLDYSL